MMKKTFSMILIAAAAIAGMSANAQDNKGCDKCKVEGFGNGKAQVAQDKMYRPQSFTDFAFEGILLDIDQQTRIDSLNSAMKEKCTANRPACDKAAKKCDKASCDKADKKCDKATCDKADKKCDKATCDKAKCDKADKKECCKDKKGKFDKGRKGGPKGMKPEFMEEYIVKVQEILTPEQFNTFKQNLSKMAPAKGKKIGIDKAKKPGLGKAKKGDFKKDKIKGNNNANKNTK